jgi:hypothetical protein
VLQGSVNMRIFMSWLQAYRHNMKYITLCFLLPIVTSASFSLVDCNFNSIIPVPHGITKFQATNALFETKRYNKVRESSYKMNNEYLKKENKEVIKTTVYFQINSSVCFSGLDKEMYLVFANDRLYSINCTETFSTDSYTEMKNEYESLKGILSQKFKYESVYKKNSDGQQIGEGYTYTKIEARTKQPEELSIGFKSEKSTTIINSKSVETEVYKIEIEYNNLKGLPIDTRGY